MTLGGIAIGVYGYMLFSKGTESEKLAHILLMAAGALIAIFSLFRLFKAGDSKHR